ncbi:MAG TPA: ABC transporter substrate-binding protein [Azospira sp.]|nr:ABC transporter substrate-binding protein [Azospira sp.]HNN09329.1 ABC transporter substrate-binding protein [Azospira sp.]HNN46285.1 ABC transporter substrate-binding protein [Azospira sp.]
MKLVRKLALMALIGWMGSAMAADVGVTDSSVTLGMSSPFSGPNGAYGQDMKNVITAYFDQINKAGGVNGRKIDLVALDDGYETDRTVANSKKLIDESKVFALLQYYGSSPTTQAMNDVFGPAKVPLVGTISGAGTLRQSAKDHPNNKYMFNVRASYADETEAIVNQLVGLGLKNIAVFYQNDGFGLSGLDGVKAALKKHNMEPSAVGTVERNSLDVDAAVKAIAKSSPQAVVMVTLYKPTAAFVKAMRKINQNPQFMTLSPVGADLLVAELGNDARGIGISQVMPYPFNDTTPVVREYQRLMQGVKSANYSYYGIEAYITAKVMVEAIKRSGKDLTREKLVQTLEGMSNFDLGGFRVSFTANERAGSRFVDLTVVGSGGRVLR